MPPQGSLGALRVLPKRKSGSILLRAVCALAVCTAAFAAWRYAWQGESTAPPYAQAQHARKPLMVGVIPVTVRHEFNFINTTEAPLSIAKVETTCSCTSHEESAEPIAPGETGFVRLTMAMYQSGPKSTQVKILWSSGEETIYTLQGEARALAELGADKQRINLRPGESAEVALWLSTLSDEMPDLSIKGSNAHVSAESEAWRVVSAGEIEKGISRRYAAHIRITAAAGAPKETTLQIRAAGAEPIGVLVRIDDAG